MSRTPRSSAKRVHIFLPPMFAVYRCLTTPQRKIIRSRPKSSSQHLDKILRIFFTNWCSEFSKFGRIEILCKIISRWTQFRHDFPTGVSCGWIARPTFDQSEAAMFKISVPLICVHVFQKITDKESSLMKFKSINNEKTEWWNGRDYRGAQLGCHPRLKLHKIIQTWRGKLGTWKSLKCNFIHVHHDHQHVHHDHQNSHACLSFMPCMKQNLS